MSDYEEDRSNHYAYLTVVTISLVMFFVVVFFVLVLCRFDLAVSFRFANLVSFRFVLVSFRKVQ